MTPRNPFDLSAIMRSTLVSPEPISKTLPLVGRFSSASVAQGTWQYSDVEVLSSGMPGFAGALGHGPCQQAGHVVAVDGARRETARLHRGIVVFPRPAQEIVGGVRPC